MKRDNLRLFGIGILLGAGIVAVSVWADEKIEMSTYVPATLNGDVDRFHAKRATVGTPYSITNPAEPAPADGVLLVKGNIGIDPTTSTPRSPAPNGSATGNLEANDVYLRSVSRWLSQGGGGSTVSGTYTGGGGIQAISLGFTPKGVIVVGNGILFVKIDRMLDFGCFAVNVPGLGLPGGTSAIKIVGNGFQVTSFANSPTRTYSYLAIP